MPRVSFAQNFMVHPAWVPVDVNAGAVTAEFVEVTKHSRITFVAIQNDAAQQMTYTFNQASDNAGTGAKTLIVTGVFAGITDYWEMTHASSVLTAGLTYTHTTQTAATTVLATSGQASVIVVEFDSSMFDVANSFTWVRCVPTEDAANAQIAAGFWILGGTRYAQDVIATASGS